MYAHRIPASVECIERNKGNKRRVKKLKKQRRRSRSEVAYSFRQFKKNYSVKDSFGLFRDSEMLELAKWWQAKIESKTGLMLNTRFGFMYVCLVSQDALAIVSFDQIGRTKPLLVDGNFYPFQHNFLEKMLWAIAHEQASLFSLRTFMRELMLWSSLPVSELEAKIKVPYLNSVEGCGEKLVIEEAVAFLTKVDLSIFYRLPEVIKTNRILYDNDRYYFSDGSKEAVLAKLTAWYQEMLTVCKL